MCGVVAMMILQIADNKLCVEKDRLMEEAQYDKIGTDGNPIHSTQKVHFQSFIEILTNLEDTQVG